MLTGPEQRSYEVLLKVRKRWKYGRYVALVLGLGIAVMGALLRLEWEGELLTLTRSMSSDPLSGIEVYFAAKAAVIIAQSHLLLPLGFGLVGWAVGRWKGDPTTTLVLGLAERLGAHGK